MKFKEVLMYNKSVFDFFHQIQNYCFYKVTKGVYNLFDDIKIRENNIKIQNSKKENVKFLEKSSHVFFIFQNNSFNFYHLFFSFSAISYCSLCSRRTSVPGWNISLLMMERRI